LDANFGEANVQDEVEYDRSIEGGKKLKTKKGGNFF
jgi:hypothetical protein